MGMSFEVNAEVRTETGKGAIRRLRRADKVPGIVYGIGKEPVSLTMAQNKLRHAMEHEAFFSSILSLNIDGNKEQVVLKAVQRHAYKPKIEHLDFLRIDPKAKITMHIPLHFIGGDIAPGVKTEGGIVSHMMSDLEIKCLPADLPNNIEVDISGLELNQTLHLLDLKLPEGVEIVTLLQDPENNQPVVNVHMPRVIKEPVEEVEEAAEGAEAAPAEGEEGKGEEKKADDKPAEPKAKE